MLHRAISEGKGGNKCGIRRVKEGGERKIRPITEDKSRLRHAPMGRCSKPEREDLLSIKLNDQRNRRLVIGEISLVKLGRNWIENRPSQTNSTYVTLSILCEGEYHRKVLEVIGGNHFRRL